MLLWAATAAADPTWSPREVAPGRFGPALAYTSSWDGAPAWFSGGPGGIRVLDGSGNEVVSSTSFKASALVVRQLDGVGEDEILACGAAGIVLIRGNRQGLTPPNALTTRPCEDLVAYDLGLYPGLASISNGVLVTWTPARGGLTELGTTIRGRSLATAGRRVGLIESSGDLRFTEPLEVRPGPFVALTGSPSGFAWVGPQLQWSGGTLPEPVSGIVTDGTRTWFLDRLGGRFRASDGPWQALSITPDDASVSDADADGCPDLWITDRTGNGVIAFGTCAPETPNLLPVAAVTSAVEPVVPTVPTAAGGSEVAPPTPPFSPPVTLPAEPQAAQPQAAQPQPAEPQPAEPQPAEPLRGPLPVAANGVPPAPTEVVFAPDQWVVLNVRPGESLVTQLSFGDSRAWEWVRRGGPPGLALSRGGDLALLASEVNQGRWRISLRAREGFRVRRMGVEVRVWPAETPFAPVAAAEVIPMSPTADQPSDRLRVWASAGLAAGVARNNGSQFENLGERPTGGGVSPTAAALAEVQILGPLSVWGGFDSAPLFSFPSSPGRRTHLLATTVGALVGTRTVRVGPYGTLGYTVQGAGVRLAVTPFEDARNHATGPELRVTWLAPQVGAEASLAWTWEL